MNRRPLALTDWVMDQWLTKSYLYWSLMPVSWLYALFMRMRLACYRHGLLKATRLAVPVIVVGNLFVGGTGKTPVVLALIQALQQAGKRPGLISRGYKSLTTSNQAARVGQMNRDGPRLSAQLYGDEPALIANLTGIPIAVHPKRVNAARALLAQHADTDVLICDDGLQHLPLARDLELVVQDQRGIGNGLTFPAGPLREAPCRLLSVDAVLTRQSDRSSSHLSQRYPSNAEPVPQHAVYHTDFMVCIDRFVLLHNPTVTLSVQAFLEHLATHATRRLCAMAAIGLPERFFLELQQLGLVLDQTIALPDHATITAEDLHRLKATEIIITAKDAVKLNDVVDQRIWVAQTHLQWFDPRFTRWVIAQC